MKDFVPVAPINYSDLLLVVHPSVPVKSVKELIALAKARPDEILYGSSGSGSFLHLTMVQLNVMSGARMVHVPYKGGDAAGVSLVAGETQAMIATMPVVKPLLAGNRVRVLAVTSDTRVRQLPDVPTLAEAGVPGYELTAWVGAFVPAGTRRAIVDRLNAEIMKAINLPDTKQRLDDLGVVTANNSAEDFGRFMHTEAVKWAEVVRIANVKAE